MGRQTIEGLNGDIDERDLIIRNLEETVAQLQKDLEENKITMKKSSGDKQALPNDLLGSGDKPRDKAMQHKRSVSAMEHRLTPVIGEHKRTRTQIPADLSELLLVEATSHSSNDEEDDVPRDDVIVADVSENEIDQEVKLQDQLSSQRGDKEEIKKWDEHVASASNSPSNESDEIADYYLDGDLAQCSREELIDQIEVMESKLQYEKILREESAHAQQVIVDHLSETNEGLLQFFRVKFHVLNDNKKKKKK